MHQTQSNLRKLKNIFILGQMGVLFAALAVLFSVMILGYREKVLHILLLKLDASTESMASQLKANQVPLASTGEHGVFIISQNDGSMVIDRHNDTPVDKQLWASYRTKLIYEMQKQKRGWIVYPDKQWWNLKQEQRVIRYVPIDELGWILAIEVPRPTEIELLKEAVKPSIFLTLFFISFIGAFLLWFMTDRYFNMMRRYIAQTVESNMMSLGGEEKVWEEFPANTSKPPDDLQKEAIGLSFKNESQLPLQKPVTENKFETVKAALPQKTTEEPKHKAQEESNLDQLTINVNHITSPVLRKIIQQFRDK